MTVGLPCLSALMQVLRILTSFLRLAWQTLYKHRTVTHNVEKEVKICLCLMICAHASWSLIVDSLSSSNTDSDLNLCVLIRIHYDDETSLELA